MGQVVNDYSIPKRILKWIYSVQIFQFQTGRNFVIKVFTSDSKRQIITERQSDWIAAKTAYHSSFMSTTTGDISSAGKWDVHTEKRRTFGKEVSVIGSKRNRTNVKQMTSIIYAQCNFIVDNSDLLDYICNSNSYKIIR